jgi:hypothetical protein
VISVTHSCSGPRRVRESDPPDPALSRRDARSEDACRVLPGLAAQRGVHNQRHLMQAHLDCSSEGELGMDPERPYVCRTRPGSR